jgi:hypothetical protein
MVRIHFGVGVIAILAMGRAHAQEWACWNSFDNNKKVLVRLYEDSGDKSEAGLLLDQHFYRETEYRACRIHAAGREQFSACSVQGINRRWDFGWKYGMFDEGPAPYAFIITPSGQGSYYDFSTNSTAYPSQTYKCKAS